MEYRPERIPVSVLDVCSVRHFLSDSYMDAVGNCPKEQSKEDSVDMQSLSS